MIQQNNVITIFCCYAREDKDFLDELKKHLSALRRQNRIDIWYDGEIIAGTEWAQVIKMHLNTAKVILLLISPDFINSDYCYSVEMHSALERHKQRDARVIPIILRPVGGWEKIPPGDIQLGYLQALPRDAKPVTMWVNRDEVWAEVVGGIERAISELSPRGPGPIVKSKPDISRRTVLVLAGLGTIATVGVTYGVADFFMQMHKARGSTFLTPTATHPSATPTATLPESSLYTYRGHLDAVNTVVWSHDGKQVASGSDDKTVQLWNITNGDLIYKYSGHSNGVNAVAWSPDGNRLASASDDHTAQVWDATSGKAPVIYHHKAEVRDITWSPNGQHVASASWDGTVQIWDANTGVRILTYNGHAGYEVFGVAWSPNGKYIASCGNDATVQVWDPTNSAAASQGTPIYTYNGHDSNFTVNRVAWSPDSRRVASASYDGTAQVWDATTGDNHTTFSNHNRWVLCVAWSPNDQYIATGSDDQTMKVWNTVTRDVLHTYTGHTNRVKGVASSSDGKLLVTGSDDTTAMIWKAP